MKNTILAVGLFLFVLQIGTHAFAEMTMTLDNENKQAVVYNDGVQIAIQTFDEDGNFTPLEGYIPDGQVNAFYNDEYGFMTYKNNVPHGKALLFYPTGKIHFEGKYKDGVVVGEKKEYYRNGKILKHHHFRDGKRYGQWREYYPDGMLKSEAFYENDTLVEQKENL